MTPYLLIGALVVLEVHSLAGPLDFILSNDVQEH